MEFRKVKFERRGGAPREKEQLFAWLSFYQEHPVWVLLLFFGRFKFPPKMPSTKPPRKPPKPPLPVVRGSRVHHLGTSSLGSARPANAQRRGAF